MTGPVLEVDWFAECSRDGCDGLARWVSRNPAATGGVLIPAQESCPVCGQRTAVHTEPPPLAAPKVSTALAYIAQRMLGGTG